MKAKKIFAGLLAAVTCASVLPLTAFATDTGGGGEDISVTADSGIQTYGNYNISTDHDGWGKIESSYSAFTLENGGSTKTSGSNTYYVYYLSEDVDLTGTVSTQNGTTSVLDLNGHTLELSSPLEVNKNSTLYIIDSNLSGNGGVICSNPKTNSNGLPGSSITLGTYSYAGVIYVASGGTLTLEGGTYTGSMSGVRNAGGGVIYNLGTTTITGDTVLTGSLISSHSGGDTHVYGGAVFNGQSATFTMEENASISDFDLSTSTTSGSSNKANAFGGAIYNEGEFMMSEGASISDITMTVSSDKNNSAYAYGGAIYNASGTTKVSDTEITGCQSTGSDSADGGAIYNASGTTTVSGGLIKGNTADASGGGIYVAGGSVSLKGNLLIYANTAGTNGNDFRIASSGGGSLALADTVNNYASTKHLYTESTDDSLNGFNDGEVEMIGWYSDTNESKYSNTGKSSATSYNDSFSDGSQTFSTGSAVIAAYGPTITYVYTTNTGGSGYFSTACVTSEPIDILYTSHGETLMSAGEFGGTTAWNTYSISDEKASTSAEQTLKFTSAGNDDNGLMPDRYCSIAGWATTASRDSSDSYQAWIAADSGSYEMKHDCGESTSTTFPTNTTLYAVYNTHGVKTLVSAVDATCSTTGHTEIDFCETCGGYFSDGSETQYACETKIGQSTNTYEGLVDESTVTLYAADWENDVANESNDSYNIYFSPALGHSINASYINKIAEQPATCSANGIAEHYYCTECGKTFVRCCEGTCSDSCSCTCEECECADEGCTGDCTCLVEAGDLTIAALGHTCCSEKMTYVAGTEGDCQVYGHKAYWFCSSCGTYFAATDDCTCTFDENGKCTCDECTCKCGEDGTCACVGTKYDDGLPYYTEKGAHNAQLIEEVPSTCSTYGHDAYYVCTICGKIVEWKCNCKDCACECENCSEENPCNCECGECEECGCGYDVATSQDIPTKTAYDSTNHSSTLQQVDPQPATCVQAGHDAYEYCTDCGAIFVWECNCEDCTGCNCENCSAECECECVECEDCGCGYVTKESVPTIGALGDDYHTVVEGVPANTVPIDAQDATCTQQGHPAYYYCADCGACFTTEAFCSCDENCECNGACDGECSCECDDCLCLAAGEKIPTDKMNLFFTPIDETNHVHIATAEAQPATCVQAGHDAYEYCTDCGTIVVWECNCEEACECTDCSAECDCECGCGYVTATEDDLKKIYTEMSEDDLAAPANHTSVQSVDAQLATCVQAGHDAYEYCEACGTTFVYNSEAGSYVKGDVVYTETLDKTVSTNHTELLLVAESASTCSEYGHDAYWYCSDCGTMFADNNGSAGNKIDDIPTKSDLDPDNHGVHITKIDGTVATCSKSGHDDYWYCSACENSYFDENDSVGAKMTDEELENFFSALDPTNHTDELQYVAAAEPTCSREGHEAYYYCSYCGNYYADATGETGIELSDISTPSICDDTDLTDAEKEELLANPENHTLSNVVPVATATCSLEGHDAYYQCEDCGMYFTVETTEEYDEVTGETTTTETPGEATTHDELILDVLGHDKDDEYIEFVDAADPTCAFGGHDAYYHCKSCGRYFAVDENGNVGDELTSIETTEKDSTNHIGYETVDEVASTCSEQGHNAYYRCTGCGECFKINEDGSVGDMITDMSEIAKDIDPTAHVIISIESVAPTCTTTGHVAYDYCEHCGTYFVDGEEVDADSLTIDIDPTAHVIISIEAVAPTCTTTGHVAYDYCEHCGAYFVDGEEVDADSLTIDIDPTAHVIEFVDAADSTCSEHGHDAYYHCTACGTYFFVAEDGTIGEEFDDISLVQKDIDPDAHTFELIAETDSTCTEHGHVAYYHCTSCGADFTENEDGTIGEQFTKMSTVQKDLDSDNHMLIYVEATEPTYDSVGNIEYWYCAGCGAYFADEDATIAITYSDTVIPMLTETEGSETTDTEGTETTEASETTEPVVSETTETTAGVTMPTETTEPVGSETTELVVSETTEPVVSETTEAVVSETTETTAGVTMPTETTEPVVSETTEPVVSETTEPVVSETTEPVVSETTEPIVSETTEPVVSETTELVVSETTEPIVSETTEPVVSETTEPIVSETTEPIVSETTEPVVSKTTEAVGSESTEPVVSESTETTTEPVESSENDDTDALLLGNTNLDGEITPNDSYLILVYYANEQLGLNPTFSDDPELNERIKNEVADVNGDGNIDANDSYYILCYYAEYQLMGTADWEDILAKY